MKKNKTFSILFVASVLFLSGFNNKTVKIFSEDKWSGAVTFHEEMTGPTIARHDWWMIATITDNLGNALDSAIFESTEGDKWRCATSGKTELELGIEEDKAEFGITVRVPGCYGYSIDKYGVRTGGYGLTDETAIVINKQPLTNPDVLVGNLVLRDFSPDGTQTITTYSWNLKKSK